MINFIKKLITASLARQLIVGIAAVHAVLMTIFVFDLVHRQRDFMLEQNTQQALGLAATLATNGASWVLANDLVGIEEIISSQNNYPDLRYAMFIDNRGKLLGYSDREKTGLFIDDKTSALIFDGINSEKILINTSSLIDVAAPIRVNNQVIGWARVGISRSSMSDNLNLVTVNGLIYTVIAILVGIIFAWGMARGLSGGIRELKLAMDKISTGSRDVQCELDRDDELGDLSDDFNKMLSTIKHNETAIVDAHKALIKSERKTSQLIDNLRTEYIFYSHDLNGVFTYLSPSIYDVLGYTQKEYMQKYDTYFTDNSINDEAVSKTQQVMLGKRIDPYEVEVFHKSGSKRLMEVTESALIDSNGNVVAVEGLARDVTEIRQVYQNLREEKTKYHREKILLDSIINAIPDQIYYKDSNGIYIGSNKAFKESMSFTEENMCNKTDSELFGTKRTIKIKEICEEISRSNSLYLEESVIIEKDGKERIFDVIHTPFRNESEELLGFIQISRDVTDLRNKESQLRHSRKMDALGKLTGGIAHDYNNLLGVVIGYAELLSMTTTDDKLKVYADEILKAGNRGSNLTAKLLSFTRNNTPEAKTVHVAEILKTDLNMIQKTLTARINVTLDLDENTWDLWLDQNDFQDSVLNISINAMHAMPDGGNYTISTRNVELTEYEAGTKELLPGEYVKLSFTDTGCGMDEMTKDQLFDPFFTTKGDKGSGLGMSQVFGFVKRSNGHIEVESEPDQGTTVNLYFKRSANTNHEGSDHVDNIKATSGTGQKILVVDDEPALKLLASEILTKNGFRVFEANSAKEALDVLKHNTVELVVSDIIMPEMDGYELATEIKREYPDTKILLASGYSNTNSKNQAHRDLSKNILNKPYSSDDLINAVSNLI